METPGSKGKGHQELQISTTTTHVIGMFVATSVTIYMQILGRSRRQTEDPDQEKYKHCDNQLVEIQRVDK